MKKFLTRLLSFMAILMIVFAIGVLLPATPRASKSFLFSSLKKDSLLTHTKAPRIIFVGGSNISFSLHSPTIRDSLKINPINTGVMANLGLKYMLDNTLNYVQANDIVVLIPEYQHFFREYSFGTEELLRTVFDVNRKKMPLLGSRQWFNLIPHIPKYALTKFNPGEYWGYEESDVYHVDSYNEFGDTNAHYGLERRPFVPFKLDGAFDSNNVAKIDEFRQKVEAKNAVLLVSYPSYQDRSFQNYEHKIRLLEEEYSKYNFFILGTPERYMFPDSLFFNTPYHTTKKGVDRRTQLFLEDFRLRKHR